MFQRRVDLHSAGPASGLRVRESAATLCWDACVQQGRIGFRPK